MEKLNFRQFTFAREYRGLTQTELAKRVKGLSQSNLSKFEQGLETLSEEVLGRIKETLDFPDGFFYENILNKIENAHYRKKAGLTKGERNKIEYSNKIIGYIIDKMGESVEYPEYHFTNFDLEDGYTPESIALFTRKQLRLNDKPFENIVKELELRGIIVYEIDAVEGFDGVSFITDNSLRVIVINKNYSNDRKRRTLAHELGHIIMHLDYLVPDIRDKENEADRFASELLMPKEYIEGALRYLTFKKLGELKQYWLTSMFSIAVRAKELKCISAEQYKNICIQFSRKGYRKAEPINVYIDTPSIFNEAYRLHKEALHYSDQDLSKAFSLPLDIITNFCCQSPLKLRVLKNNFSIN